MDDQGLLELLGAAAGAVRGALDELEDWGPAGTRPGQYRLDLAADAAVLGVLGAEGLSVLSEESGLSVGSGSDDLLAVVDPVDGSTNAHLGLPFYATSICVLDERGPRVGLVRNQATGVGYAAIRGEGARRDGISIEVSSPRSLGDAVVGVSGFPARHPGWAQFRALGAASLELCAVADGSLDAYLVVGGAHLFGWDYLAGMLICHEAGGVMADRSGEDLVVRTDAPRHPAAAATQELLHEVLDSGL
ncbi:MAG TPA: inositol monophosphatase family protein [Acidimicrobiales bacterium]